MSDYRMTTGDAPPESRRQRSRRLRRIAIVLGALAAAALIAGTVVRVDRYVACPGYVTSETYSEVRSAAVGSVSEILVHTGDRVRKGDALARLDDAEQRAALSEERRRESKLNAELIRLQLEIAEEQRMLAERIALAELRLEDARARTLRTRNLLENGLAAVSALDDAKLTENLVGAELNSLLKKDRTLYEKRVNVLKEEILVQGDVVAGAEARLRIRTITAPVDGQAVRYDFTVGEPVGPTTVLYEIFGDDMVLKIRVDERHAVRIAPGDRYRARLGSHRGLRSVWFHGTVIGLRDVIQGEEDRRYRMARCTFDAGGRTVPPGTTAEVRVYVGRSSFWLYLLGLD